VSPRHKKNKLTEPVITGDSGFESTVARYHGLNFINDLFLGLNAELAAKEPAQQVKA